MWIYIGINCESGSIKLLCPITYTLRINTYIQWTYLMAVVVRNDFTEMSCHPALGFENFVGHKDGRWREAVTDCFLCPVVLRIAILWTYLISMVLVRRDFTEMTLQPAFGFEIFVAEKSRWSSKAAAASVSCPVTFRLAI